MSDAVKYFQKNGLKNSKKHLLNIREAVNQVSWVHSLEGFSQDLKRLVESHELVESLGGFGKAYLRMQKAEKDNHSVMRDLIKQAITDVEACKEVS